ncbi:3058_t:CDS:2 [Funneliformis mosseae]|uniref:3058_t:CDS:1 n=1 Tax=Funneliformis mosseae TaxID=27381 RepID=A0A9N9DMA3_FUNMO|nr:3058_t:CDS:2 [Funneliformis mosseae]
MMELHSKACVAESIIFEVDNEKEESVNLEEYENFSCNLAIILARNREVVAVRLIHHANKCDVYLAKNSPWTNIDVEYIDEIEKYVKSLSKDAHIKLEVALEREDVGNLFGRVLEYCSAKIDNRFEKLKGDIKDDIKNNKQDPHIRTFMDYANINAKNIDEVDGYTLSPSQYKLQFANIRVRRIDPVIINQPISFWKNTVQRYIPDPAQYEEFKRRCLNDKYISGRLTNIYGSVDGLDNEDIKQRIFVNRKGYKVYTSGAHKKLFSKWLLPELKDISLRNESLNYMINQLDKVINKEIAKH